MNAFDVRNSSLVLGVLALTLSAASLFFNKGFGALVSASSMGVLIVLIVLVVCGLVVMAVLMERSWWPNMFYLAGLMYCPTVIGLSRADWFTWLGFPRGLDLFTSSLPDVVCLAVGTAIVAGYLLGWAADHLNDMGRSLIARGASPDEVVGETTKGFARLSARVGSMASVIVVLWIVGSTASDLGGKTIIPASGYLLIALVAGCVLVALSYTMTKGNRSTEDPDSVGPDVKE